MNWQQHKIFFLRLCFIILISWKSDGGTQKEYTELIINQQYAFEIHRDEGQYFKIVSHVDDLIRVNVQQCEFDVEIKFQDPKGEWVLIDQLSGNKSLESFFVEISADEPFIFEVYSIEPFKKYGYVEITFESVKQDPYFHKKMQAERFYMLGGRKLYAADKKQQSEAVGEFKKALRIYQTLDEPALKAETLSKLGLSYYRLGEFSKAIDYCFMALEAYHSYGQHRYDGYLYNTVGASFHRENDIESALNYYKKTILAWEKSERKSTISTTLINVSTIHFYQGDYQLAKLYLDLAYEWSKHGRNFNDFITAYNQLGKHYYFNGQYEKSLELFKQAVEIGDYSNNITSDAYVIALINLGQSYMNLKQFSKARMWTNKAIQAAKRIHFQRTEGMALLSLGNIELSDGHFAAAKQLFLESLQKETKDWADNAYLSLAIAAYFQANHQDLPKADKIQFLEEAMSYIGLLRENSPDSWVETQSYYWEARVMREQGLPKAIQQLSKGILRVEDVRHQTEDRQSQVSFFATQIHFYQLRLDLLFQEYSETGKESLLNDFFETNEQIRARALLDDINHLESPSSDLPNSADLQAYFRLLFELETHFFQDEAVVALEKRLTPLAKKMALLDSERILVPPIATQKTGAISRRLKDPETLLLSYAFGHELAYLIALDQEGVNVYPLGDPELLREQVFGILGALQKHPHKRDDDWAALQKALAAISETILTGPLNHLSDYRRLVFIPDKFLHLIPFAALRLQLGGEREDSSQLVDHFEMAILPSASVWQSLQRQSDMRKPGPTTMAILANPVLNLVDQRLLGKSLSPDQRPFISSLPGTQREAEGIAALVPGQVSVKAGFAANRSRVKKGDLVNYRYIHFATHADINLEKPMQSRIILSRFDEAGQPVDGSLRLGDIFELSLRAELVSLSACETALGKIIDGEGLVSLARGFMAAGVPRVVATLWPIPDDATAFFMTEFYRGLLLEGLGTAAALRQAQLKQREHEAWQDPYFWAGFVLIGDWK